MNAFICNKNKNLEPCSRSMAKLILMNMVKAKFVITDGDTETEVSVEITDDYSITCFLPYTYTTNKNIKLKSKVKIVLDVLGRDENNNQVLYVLREKKHKPTTRKDNIKLKPFDKVLVRDYDVSTWIPAHLALVNENRIFPYMTTNRLYYKYCIPYKGNEHLVGTTDSPK